MMYDRIESLAMTGAVLVESVVEAVRLAGRQLKHPLESSTIATAKQNLEEDGVMLKSTRALIGAIAVIGLFGCARNADNTSDSLTADSAAAASAPAKPETLSLRPTVGGTIPGQYIVRLRRPSAGGGRGGAAGGRAPEVAIAAPQVASIARDVAQAAGIERVEMTFVTVFPGFVAKGVDSAHAVALRADPRVQRVTPDRVASAAGLGRLSVPAFQQPAPWGLDRIDAAGPDNRYDYTATGQGVDIYVFDTGVFTGHQEFQGRADVWWDAFADGRNGQDCNGHGTHVAGIIGGRTYGVAKDSRVHAVRVLGCDGYGAWSTIIAGIDRLASEQREKAAPRTVIVNVSVAGDGADIDLDEAFAAAVNAGILFVVAAGNDDKDACQQTSAHSPVPLRVGASTQSDERASFSNSGPCVDVFAPGEDIQSAWWTGPAAEAYGVGTSMAAPHVAGVAAQLLQSSPAMLPRDVRLQLTAARGRIIHNGNSAGKYLVRVFP